MNRASSDYQKIAVFTFPRAYKKRPNTELTILERGLKVDTMVLEVLSVITAERAVSCFKQHLG